jgi:hypothetical protein
MSSVGEKLKGIDSIDTILCASGSIGEKAHIRGWYSIELTDEEGKVLWSEICENTVVTVGMNEILTAALTGSSYTVTGPYMFLISSVGYSAISAADTMASHSGWNEAQNSGTNTPAFGTTRPTVSFSTSSGGSIVASSTQTFVFTSSGTVQGAGMVFGPSASATVGNTSGVLLSASAFGTAQPVISGNTLTVGYTLAL